MKSNPLHLKMIVLAIFLAIVLYFQFFFDFDSWIGDSQLQDPETPAQEEVPVPTE
ncbi:MAG: hypothetical protein AB7T49_05460 [Oligoflexales bacterium]